MQSSVILAAVMGQPGLASVTWYVGAEYRHQEDAPNRIVFVPVGAKYGPVEMHRRPVAGTAAIRPIATRSVEFDAYLWAQGPTGTSTSNLDAVETLLNNFLGALNDSIGDAEVVADRALKVDGSQDTDAGIVFVLTFRLGVPVTRPINQERSLKVVGSSPTPGVSVAIADTEALTFPSIP